MKFSGHTDWGAVSVIADERMPLSWSRAQFPVAQEDAEWWANTEYWQRCAANHQKYVYALIKLLQPRTVVETGIYNGGSTTAILKALEETGLLCSCDPMYKSQDVAEDRLETAGSLIRNFYQWAFLGEKSSTALPKFASQWPVWDIFIHDSDHSYENMKWELEYAYSRSRLMLVDDIDWGHRKYPHVNTPPHRAFYNFCIDKGIEYYHILGGTMAVIPGGLK